MELLVELGRIVSGDTLFGRGRPDLAVPLGAVTVTLVTGRRHQLRA